MPNDLPQDALPPLEPTTFANLGDAIERDRRSGERPR